MTDQEQYVILSNEIEEGGEEQPKKEALKKASEQTVGEMNPHEFAQLLAVTILELQNEQKRMEELTGEPETSNEKKGIVGNVLGTVGNTLHGVVDLGEGLLRGVIDIGTFGNAKR